MNYSKIMALMPMVLMGFAAAHAGISISVDASSGVKKISPYIYGRNIDKVSGDSARLSDEDLNSINLMNEAGIRFVRANNGNNSTRYNWRKKLTVHPDWYNNVNAIDWDITAKKIQDNMPQAHAMYGFQLTGYAASTRDYNFADWDFKVAHGDWAKTSLDLAGGGEVADDGETLIKSGDYSLYNEAWPADSTVGIINHWMNDLNYDMSRFQYWSMDNEMEIWKGTHSDLPLDIDADFLVERYIDVAKKARAAWKDIKLTGPVVANEWQWCSVSASDGKSGLGKGEDRNYCWLEYFIKRVSEEQKKSGLRLLDVFDIHWYPTEKTYAERVNWHRVFFDTTYNYSGANGIKMVNGRWDNSQTKEYIFKRINEWLDQYFGENHGITLGVTETSLVDDSDPMTTAITYASWLGTFMDNGVELFSPWFWGDGMYEVVHLFSRYGHENRVQTVSSNDSLVSAYASINAAKDSLTVIVVNRAETESQDIVLNLDGLKNASPIMKTLTLSNLTGETFESHSVNALKSGELSLADDTLITVPAKSITAFLVSADAVTGLRPDVAKVRNGLLYENGSWMVDNSAGDIRRVDVFDGLGMKIRSFENLPKGGSLLPTANLSQGTYLIQVKTAKGVFSGKAIVK